MLKKLPLKEFKAIYAKVPRLCVELVIKTKAGFLLTKRVDSLTYGGYWHIPGGGVLYGESLEEAISRIAKDELGVGVKILKFLDYLEFSSERALGLGHSIGLAFLVKIKSGKIKLNDEASEFGFFNQLPEKIVEEHKEFLKGLHI